MEKRKGQLNLLCDIGDLAALLSESVDIEIFLQRIVRLVARNLKADVCSVYLYDERSDELVLRATFGLNPDAVGKVRLKSGEGLVGITLERPQPICEGRATMSPYYRYFEEAHEDRFESFLAAPIRRGIEKIGVLVVQHEKKNYFDEYDVMTLRVTSSQLAGALENARLLTGMNQMRTAQVQKSGYAGANFIKGKSASSGYAYAAASVMRESHGGLMTGYDESETDQTFTLKDFFVALQKTTHQLENLQEKLAIRLPESASLIFTAHFMILKDAKFIDKIVHLIEDGAPAPDAIREVAGDYMRVFLSSTHAYIREKANDMEDLAGRILNNLLYASYDEAVNERGRVIIAQDLFPSEMLKLGTEDVKGIVLVSGGVTSHVAILSRSMKIPLIIAEHRDLLDIPDGAPILLDADIGNIFVYPSESVVEHYETRNRTKKEVAPLRTTKLTDETTTRDGKRIRLMANINLLSELTLARDLNAEGVGLYRTEFPFLIRNSFPSEEEQYLVYKKLFELMAGKQITIRTLDVGGDKVLTYLDTGAEANPELGLRSIRFSLRHLEIFEQQIRAILRAAPSKETIRIMFPMISSIDEFRQARRMVVECINDLECEGLLHHQSPSIGTMLEIPSVVEIMNDLAKEADFFSIGTNDFVQYMLAVDRTNEKVANYYKPFHPSVLRAMERMALWANTWGKDISVCGEMAHEPEFIPFLLGIGIRTLSVDPQFLHGVQERISKLRLSDAEKYARTLLEQSTLKGARNVLRRHP